jgi:hypothetical protein
VEPVASDSPDLNADRCYLTLSEVQSLAKQRMGLRPHRSTVYRWTQSGALPAVWIGQRILVALDDAVGFLEARPVSAVAVREDEHRRGLASAGRIRRGWREPRRR